jgi:hypothetical protein
MKELTFNGDRMVFGPSEKGKSYSDIDIRTNRNDKMIDALMGEDANGVFLFYLYKNKDSVGKKFLMPPGLSDENTEKFKDEFLELFEKYASLANK